MIDLTRLMFDDGASRAPLRQASSEFPDIFVTFKGKNYIGRYLDAKRHVGERIDNTISFFGPESTSRASDWWGYDMLMEDPDKALNRWCSSWQNFSNRSDISQRNINEGIIWYVFEVIQ